MKFLISLVIFGIAGIAFGQTTKKVELVNFASKEFKVPAGCSASSPYQIECSDFKMLWLYMNDEMLKTMPDQAINQLSSQLKDFKKKKISAFLLGAEVKAFKISFANEANKKRGFQIVVYGIANGQPVLVQLNLEKEPNTNDDLPEFPKQIIKLGT